MTLFTPILFNLDSISIPDLRAEDPIDLFTEELDTAKAAASYILAPRFYLKIYTPDNVNQPSLIYYLHRDSTSLLLNTIRIALPPAEGFGKVVSYRVEYWKYYQLLNFPDTTITSRELFHEEFWFLPTVDENTFIAKNSFSNAILGSSLSEHLATSKTVTATRELRSNNIVRDTLESIEDIDILILQDGTSALSNNGIREFTFSPEAAAISSINPVTNSIYIDRAQDQVDGDLIDGQVQTTVNYIRPLEREEIVFKDSKDNRMYFPSPVACII